MAHSRGIWPSNLATGGPPYDESSNVNLKDAFTGKDEMATGWYILLLCQIFFQKVPDQFTAFFQKHGKRNRSSLT
jgi:hypothetical protein